MAMLTSSGVWCGRTGHALPAASGDDHWRGGGVAVKP